MRTRLAIPSAPSVHKPRKDWTSAAFEAAHTVCAHVDVPAAHGARRGAAYDRGRARSGRSRGALRAATVCVRPHYVAPRRLPASPRLPPPPPVSSPPDRASNGRHQ